MLHKDLATADEPMRRPLSLGCVVAAVAVAGCAFVGLLRPQPALGDAQIAMGRESGALYVRVGDAWHPVFNLASARLIAATPADPRPVSETALNRAKHGPLLGIPGAPAVLAAPLAAAESSWTICDSDLGAATTVIVGPGAGPALAAGEAVLVTAGAGSPAQLLFHGRRAVVELSDPSVLRALRLEGRVPQVLSPALLNAVPEAPPILVPRIRGAGGPGPAGLRFTVGSVLRITRTGGDEYYAVLAGGVQRIGQVAADLLRFSDSRGNATVNAVAPDVIGAVPIVDSLPVSTFPDRAPVVVHGATVCASWTPASGPVDISVGRDLPTPAGQAPASLAQADGRGPALDAFYLPPGRSAYVSDGARGHMRYLVTGSGVRFAIGDDEDARALGLPAVAVPAPWPVLATLPSGPELDRRRASVARDVVGLP